MMLLIILAIIWLSLATIQDFRKREIENWLPFSLIFIALAFRIFYSLFSLDFSFLLMGLLGFLITFVLAYVFYYARLFAGGDSKLLMPLGLILPASSLASLWNIGLFILLMLILGAAYSLIYSFVIVSLKRKEFAKQFKNKLKSNKIIFQISIIAAIFLAIILLSISQPLLLLVPVLIILFPILLIYSKSVEELMSWTVSVAKLTEGDWLYEPVRISKKILMPSWDGLSLKDISLIKKHKKSIKIRYGIPFAISFLLAYLALLLFQNYFYNWIGSLV